MKTSTLIAVLIGAVHGAGVCTVVKVGGIPEALSSVAGGYFRVSEGNATFGGREYYSKYSNNGSIKSTIFYDKVRGEWTIAKSLGSANNVFAYAPGKETLLDLNGTWNIYKGGKMWVPATLKITCAGAPRGHQEFAQSSVVNTAARTVNTTKKTKADKTKDTDSTIPNATKRETKSKKTDKKFKGSSVGSGFNAVGYVNNSDDSISTSQGLKSKKKSPKIVYVSTPTREEAGEKSSGVSKKTSGVPKKSLRASKKSPEISGISQGNSPSQTSAVVTDETIDLIESLDRGFNSTGDSTIKKSANVSSTSTPNPNAEVKDDSTPSQTKISTSGKSSKQKAKAETETEIETGIEAGTETETETVKETSNSTATESKVGNSTGILEKSSESLEESPSESLEESPSKSLEESSEISEKSLSTEDKDGDGGLSNSTELTQTGSKNTTEEFEVSADDTTKNKLSVPQDETIIEARSERERRETEAISAAANSKNSSNSKDETEEEAEAEAGTRADAKASATVFASNKTGGSRDSAKKRGGASQEEPSQPSVTRSNVSSTDSEEKSNLSMILPGNMSSAAGSSGKKTGSNKTSSQLKRTPTSKSTPNATDFTSPFPKPETDSKTKAKTSLKIETKYETKTKPVDTESDDLISQLDGPQQNATSRAYNTTGAPSDTDSGSASVSDTTGTPRDSKMGTKDESDGDRGDEGDNWRGSTGQARSKRDRRRFVGESESESGSDSRSNSGRSDRVPESQTAKDVSKTKEDTVEADQEKMDTVKEDDFVKQPIKVKPKPHVKITVAEGEEAMEVKISEFDAAKEYILQYSIHPDFKPSRQCCITPSQSTQAKLCMGGKVLACKQDKEDSSISVELDGKDLIPGNAYHIRLRDRNEKPSCPFGSCTKTFKIPSKTPPESAGIKMNIQIRSQTATEESVRQALTEPLAARIGAESNRLQLINYIMGVASLEIRPDSGGTPAGKLAERIRYLIESKANIGKDLKARKILDIWVLHECRDGILDIDCAKYKPKVENQSVSNEAVQYTPVIIPALVILAIVVVFYMKLKKSSMANESNIEMQAKGEFQSVSISDEAPGGAISLIAKVLEDLGIPNPPIKRYANVLRESGIKSKDDLRRLAKSGGWSAAGLPDGLRQAIVEELAKGLSTVRPVAIGPTRASNPMVIAKPSRSTGNAPPTSTTAVTPAKLEVKEKKKARKPKRVKKVKKKKKKLAVAEMDPTDDPVDWPGLSLEPTDTTAAASSQPSTSLNPTDHLDEWEMDNTELAEIDKLVDAL
uniref:Uncharacterized protein n=1 Tax=Amorphochlora amoebiformis TaxID=1561963 RepID=A0A7S0DIG0_9EUKA|mmetsp:Transcript_29268/g.46720  ORF Transcript_29268/g.46720 Transcript_29268/m.46720 type:complete len:1274 (+) Transcript_29268:33-3854(+)